MALFSQVSFDFRLHNEFTFANFVAGEKNRELLSLLANAQLENPAYFLWGAKGSGKSHLLQACCAAEPNSVYLPLAVYAEYGDSVLAGLEQLDLICIDDIQAVLPSIDWEENLFKLFNLVQQNGKHLIFASQLAPAALEFSLADLKSRLSSSMIYQVHELDDEDKFQALQIRARAIGMPLEDDVLRFICTRAERSSHHLFQLLDELAQSTLDEKRKLTVPYVKNLMRW